MSGFGWCVLSALCFLQFGVAILLLLFPLVLLGFVSFFVGLLCLLRLRWLLLRCIFLRDFGLLLLRFLCSGSAGLSFLSFPHPSFLFAYFVLSLLFSLGRFCGCPLRLLVLSCCFVSCGCLHFLGVPFGIFWHFHFLVVSSFPGFFLPLLCYSG